MMPPRISIVIPSRNASATLARCLASVTQQSYTAREIIVVDGMSSDGTAEILTDWRPEIDVLIREPDSGIYDAMNKGAARSTSEYLYFLGCDDEFFYPKALADIFEDPANRRYDYIYGNVLHRGSGLVYGSRFDRT